MRSWIVLLPVVCLFLLVSQNIDLAKADLGRHIMNGQLIWTSGLGDVLSQNFYSFTQMDFPFINHHWLSGVVFYGVHQSAGFAGLVVHHSLLLCLALILMWNRRSVSLSLAAALIVLPLMAFRGEVRPEDFSYFLVGLFLTFKDSKWSKLIFPILMCLWVNLHIYFILGFVILSAQGFEIWAQRKPSKWKDFLTTAGLCGIAVFITPLGYKLTFYPLQIFSNFGYMTAEAQSPWFCFQRNIFKFEVVYFWVLLACFLGILISAFRKRHWRELPWAWLGTALFAAALSMTAVRNIALFGLLFAGLIPRLDFLKEGMMRKSLPWVSALCLLGATVFNYDRISYLFGFGLTGEGNRSAEFFREAGLKGPIFNNYDIGSFLIYNLFPKEKVFVDNRPEAYPAEFFQKVYQPMQESEAEWQTQLKKFDFNVIYFYRLDQTPWAQPFLIRRVQDPDWFAVYVDSETLILIRNKPENQAVIKAYGLPKSMFKSTPTS
jgi:hypothetical protein